jgi:hypothetical protein
MIFEHNSIHNEHFKTNICRVVVWALSIYSQLGVHSASIIDVESVPDVGS